MASEPSQQEQTFAESILGKDFFTLRWVRRWSALPPVWQVVTVVAGLGAVLYLPYLGAVGLWDPWETHYGEVARMMIYRNDYVYPWWESSWFFSKPPVTMWMDAVGLRIAFLLDAIHLPIIGGTRVEGAMPIWTEWMMRLPFALSSIGSLCLLAVALLRTTNKRITYGATFALATMPLYWLLTRQAVTDTPYVACDVSAIACVLIAHFDPNTKHRTAWWYAFYCFCGFAVLAKEMLFAVMPATFALYFILCEMPWDATSLNDHARWLVDERFRKAVKEGRQPMPYLWNQFFRMRLGTGIIVWFLICAPWVTTLCFFHGVDDEGKVFWYRFFIHDNFARLTAGVHTTTPGGTFIYFIEQGGYAMFPWVALLPGAFAIAARVKLRQQDLKERVAFLALCWGAISFFIVGASATKFHHYVFPVLPAAAVLMGFFIDRLWEEGAAQHAVSLILGFILFVLVGKDLASTPKDFTDLFVYNYDRPYPQELVERPLQLFNYRNLWAGDILCVLLLAFGAYMLIEAFRAKEKSVANRAIALGLTLAGVALLVSLSSGGHVSTALFLGLALAIVAIYVGWEGSRSAESERTTLYTFAGLIGFVALLLCVSSARQSADQLYTSLTETVNIKTELGVGFAVGGGLCVIAALQRSRTMLFASFWGLAMAFAVWFNWGHWVDLSHHWTQRDQFWRYYAQRRHDEPIAAFLMNWRGETFYSRNTVKQIKDNAFFERYASLPGRKWSLVEHYRLNILKAAVGPNRTVTTVDPGLNNKFVLVSIE